MHEGFVHNLGLRDQWPIPPAVGPACRQAGDAEGWVETPWCRDTPTSS